MNSKKIKFTKTESTKNLLRLIHDEADHILGTVKPILATTVCCREDLVNLTMVPKDVRAIKKYAKLADKSLDPLKAVCNEYVEMLKKPIGIHNLITFTDLQQEIINKAMRLCISPNWKK